MLLRIGAVAEPSHFALIVEVPDVNLILFHHALRRCRHGELDINEDYHNLSAVKEQLRREALKLNGSETGKESRGTLAALPPLQPRHFI